MEHRADVAVVGAGILGLAHAYEAARRGLRVVVFEKNPRASGASVRNFGMIWPGLGYKCVWLNTHQVLARSNAVQSTGLIGGLWSDTELTVDPRVTLAKLPQYLKENFSVAFRFGCSVHEITPPLIHAWLTTMYG